METLFQVSASVGLPEPPNHNWKASIDELENLEIISERCGAPGTDPRKESHGGSFKHIRT